MSGIIHFSKQERVAPVVAGEPADSGNGYYDYGYYTVPFSGTITRADHKHVSKVFRDRFYWPPFRSMGSWKVVETTPTGGLIRFSVTYHHGD